MSEEDLMRYYPAQQESSKELIGMFSAHFDVYVPTETSITLYTSKYNENLSTEKAFALKDKERRSLLAIAFRHDLQYSYKAIGFISDSTGNRSIRMYSCLEDFVRTHVYGSCDVYYEPEEGYILLRKSGLQIRLWDVTGIGESRYREAMNSRKFPNDMLREYAVKMMLADADSFGKIDLSKSKKENQEAPAICIY